MRTMSKELRLGDTRTSPDLSDLLGLETLALQVHVIVVVLMMLLMRMMMVIL